jgi:hypothetical protein
MTAATLITNLQDTTLVGLKIGDKAVGDNTTLLLSLLNMAKDKVAEDTLLWLSGETFNMVTGTSSYTLTNMPIQIIDVFDENNTLRPRNSAEFYGYYQTSPNQIAFNNVSDGLTIKVNYYYSPPDFLIGDTLSIPSTLLSAMQYYMAHKAYAAYKGELELMASSEYYNKYINAIKDYRATTDTLDSDSVLSGNDKVWLRGIR